MVEESEDLDIQILFNSMKRVLSAEEGTDELDDGDLVEWDKCSPVCPWENEHWCMARLLSKQEDFTNQTYMLEIVIKQVGHGCNFLPKIVN